MTGLDERLDFAVRLAIEAGGLAARMRGTLGAVEAKSAIDFCTEADRAVERLIRSRVTGHFGDAMIGEEYGGEAGDSLWVVDPIDGTSGYIHGTPRWCVSLAYMRAGEIELGVIYAPADDRLFAARRGGGALLNGRPIGVSRLRHGAAPVVELGWSDRRPLGDYCTLLLRLGEIGAEFRRHGSGALGRGPYLLGERCSAADILWGTALHWTMGFKLVPDRPVFADYARRIGERPAIARARARDAELAAAQKA